jgi:hypothetical protein
MSLPNVATFNVFREQFDKAQYLVRRQPDNTSLGRPLLFYLECS